MTTPALPAAVQPALSSSWLSQAQEDAAVGKVESPIWPGPVTEDHSGGPETIPGRDPVGGQDGSPITTDQIDYVSGGGGHFNEFPHSGHAAPVAPFANQGDFLQGSGPVPDTHSHDTGGVERTERVIMPNPGKWWRRILTGMTYDQQSQVTDTAGWRQNTATGRVDLDQYQGNDSDAYDPFQVPYSERPVYANFAYEPVALDTQPDAYTPDGQLPQMVATGGQGNAVYTEPADPEMTTPGTATAIPAAPASEDVGYF